MFADMVGYTALMQDNEAEAKLKRDKFRTTLEKSITGLNGKILQYYGDGALCTFSSAIEAVSSAVESQLIFLQDPTVDVRIGIHTGDIVFDGEGIFGDGVNVASRIESIAIPGSIMISEKLFDDIKNHQEFLTRSMGLFEFKNVKNAIEVFAIANEGIVIPKRSELKGKTKERIKSIAVIPFINMSNDTDNEYFSDGITDELINTLTRVNGLQVTSRSSSFAFKGKNEDIREIGKKLNVNSVLEGSVRKAGDKVRVNAQLVNASDGYHLWSNSYNRNLEDIFELQDEIALKIANSLREKFGVQGKEDQSITRPTENVEAYNDYLLALFYQNKWTQTHVAMAIKMYHQVIIKDPGFALPYAGLAQCHSFLGSTGYRIPAEAFHEAEAMAQKSLQIDPNNVEAYLARAGAQFFFYWNWNKATGLLDSALEINSNSPEAHLFYSMYHIIMGDYDQARRSIDNALVIDPLSTHILRTKADIFYFEDEYEAACNLYQKILEFDPNYKAAEEFMGWAKLMMGQYDEAFKIFRKLENTTYAIKPEAQLGYAYALAGNTALAEEYLSKVETRSQTEKDKSYNYDLATLHTGMGNIDKAFQYLTACVDERLGQMIFFAQSPIWRPLKNDARYQQIIEKIGLDA